MIALSDSDVALGALTLQHLELLVRRDSASDEGSATIPSTAGQSALGIELAAFFDGVGCDVSIDRSGNVVARLAGRGRLADRRPLALLAHLDTARGTRPLSHLNVLRRWDGTRIPYPGNDTLDVSVAHYPDVRRYVGHDLVFGSGVAPFGLDDKLGMAHMMSLAALLAAHRDVPHVPLVLVGRPDEEIGRHAALRDVARVLAESGVTHGYTIDGLEPYEINTENFNASHARVVFATRPVSKVGDTLVEVSLGGVNTHGATARAEGHRAATRMAAEIAGRLQEEGWAAEAVWFASDAARDCDATVVFSAPDPASSDAIACVAAAIVGPHRCRGASVRVQTVASVERADGAAADMLRWVSEYLRSNPGFVLLAEESDERLGYSHPYRATMTEAGVTLDVRIRDFDMAGLEAREAHVAACAAGRPVAFQRQYVNMGPALASMPELIEWALSAGEKVGVTSRLRPIRGGTGVDPLLDAGVGVANLGTGYFAPESEKEFTSLQTMAGHARWLFALAQVATL